MNAYSGRIAVKTEVVFQKFVSESDVEPHIEVSKIRVEKIRFHVICAFHNVIYQSDLRQIGSKKMDLGHLYLQCECSLFSSTICSV